MARRFRRWEMRIKHDPQAPRRDDVLGRRTVAALTTVRDLLVLTGRGVVADPVMDEAMDERTFTEWEVEGRQPLKVPWFGDVWETFWAFDRFADRWNFAKAAARRVRDKSSNVDTSTLIAFLGFTWLAAGADVLYEHPQSVRILDALNDDYVDREDKEWGWPQLGSAIVALGDELQKLHVSRANNLRLNELRAWFVGVGRLLSPEVGLPLWVLKELGGDAEPRPNESAGEQTAPGGQEGGTAVAQFFDAGVGQKLQEVWKREDTGRNIALQRAKRMGAQLLSPLGLAMINPDLATSAAESLEKQKGAPTQQHATAKKQVKASLKAHAETYKAHPLNSPEVPSLCPSVLMILQVLHEDRSFDKTRLSLPELVLYETLQGLPGPPSPGR